MKFNVKVSELKATIQKNRAQHIANYEEALDAWRLKAIERLQLVITKLNAKEKISISSYISAISSIPESHEKDYDTALSGLEAHQDEVIELEQDEFNEYWNDKWNWKDNFNYLNSTYTGKSY